VLGIVGLAWAIGLALGCGPGEVATPDDGTVLIAHEEVFGELQRPGVVFDHELHVQNLTGSDCSTCHAEDDDGAYRFLPEEAAGSYRRAMDHFHDQCIGCHDRRRTEGETFGPDACGSCHDRRAAARSVVHTRARFDSALHARHTAAAGEKCGECHHQYDEAKGELVHVAQQEAACRDCHGAARTDDTPSLQVASHDRCISCHAEFEDKGSETGPRTCTGCHTADLPAHDGSPIPRLPRGQPDVVEFAIDGATLRPVSFDHEAHEGRAEFCGTCHHDSLAPCSECHTRLAMEEGGWINAQKAFHSLTAEQSCVGCHEDVKQGSDCAGCHQMIPVGLPEDSCELCHTGPVGGDALAMAAARTGETSAAETPSILDKAPDKVVIDALVDRFSEVEYPHEQVYDKLLQLAEDNELASHFHGPETLCYGCHHHSPAGQEPPACETCHGQPFDHRWPGRPGIKGAYHLQCVGCHEAMRIQPQECGSGCHTPRPGRGVTESHPAEDHR